jgi:Ca2+-binding RTX toxin-like protein
MASIFTHRELTVGLLLPGTLVQEDDKYFIRPPFSGTQSFDGFVSSFQSSGAILTTSYGYSYLLAPSNYLSEGGLLELTASYGDGAYWVTYYFTNATTGSGGLEQRLYGVQITDSQGDPVLDISPSVGQALLTVDLSTGVLFDEEGVPVGLTGAADIWQILLNNPTRISGTEQADVVRLTYAGYNSVDGRGGNDTITGGAGEDNITGGAGIDQLDGGAGSRDTVYFTDQTTAVRLTLSGATAATALVNGIADDVVRNFEDAGGGKANDTLVGDAFANYLLGYTGNDTLAGGLGDDTLEGEEGIDRLDGGAGFDHAVFYWEGQTVRVTLAGATPATVLLDGVANDTLVNVEAVGGGYLNDTITGDAAGNVLGGGSGNDTLSGAAGNDTLFGGGGSGQVDTLVGGVGIDTASWGSYAKSFYFDYGSVGPTSKIAVVLNGATAVNVLIDGITAGTVAAVENLIGAGGDDTFTGDALANRLDGGFGDDTLTGGAGADVLIGGEGNDRLDGGLGVDTADYSGRQFFGVATGIFVELSGATPTTVGANNFLEFDTLVNIENVIGSGTQDYLLGDGFANSLSGGGGNDNLQGYGAVDTLNGGAGVDTAFFDDKTSSVVITLNGATAVTATVGGVKDDSLVNIENLFGGAGNDTLSGDAKGNSLSGYSGNDTLAGGDGADVLSGDAGLDTLDGGNGLDRTSYVAETLAVVATLNGATAVQVTVGGINPDSVRNVEGILGGSGNDTLTGDSFRNHFEGRAGADILNGKLGNDMLIGGIDTDSDRFIFDTALGANNLDTVREFFAGTDKIVLDDDIFTRFTGTVGGTALNAANLVVGYDATAFDANDYLLFDMATGVLSYDADGSSVGAAVAVAKIFAIADPFAVDPSMVLTAGDFLIIA